MKEKIGLNALVLNQQSGGLGVYISNLINYLQKVNLNIEPKIFLSKDTYHFYSNQDANGVFQKVNILSNEPINRIIRETFIWPRILKKTQIELFHSPISYIPWGVNVPTIITIHDLGFFHFSENYTPLRLKFLKKMIAKSVKKAKQIITISNFTKNDIVNTLNVNPDKISVIYEGLDFEPLNKIYSTEELKQIKKRYHLPDKYILSVGHLEPRKNYVRLIKAFQLLIEKYKIDQKLVIVGRENWKFKEIYDLINQTALSDLIVITKFVDSGNLPAIYQNADVFVTASIFEGFGFTPLESMAAGTPVAASNCTSLPEVVADAAILFDPYDENDIAEKLHRLLTNRNLNNELIQKGFENIKRFNWDDCCKQTVGVYENMLKAI